jgi:hypothetical protein
MTQIKTYKYFTEIQNKLINEDLTGYLSEVEKRRIIELFNMEYKVKGIAEILHTPSFVLIQYLAKELGGEILKNIKFEYLSFNHGQNDYGSLYVVFTDFNKVLRSRWVYCRSLEISMELIPYPFVIHHIGYYSAETNEEIQTNKLTDRIENLCLMLDYEMHREVHAKKIKGLYELETFTRKYVEKRFGMLQQHRNNATDIKELVAIRSEYDRLRLYAETVSKQFRIQKRKNALGIDVPQALETEKYTLLLN